mmetsp:Transcript_4067/g.13063  ORF Transcript_4067/g.13063 Transcript_4067/m.13063 type:complete len:454 (+) Transcript_4067:1-1362(+)
MVSVLASGSPKAQVAALVSIRKLLSVEKNPPLQEAIDAGAVPHLVTMASQDHIPQAKFEALWALTNIASGTSAHTRVVMESGAIPSAIAALSSPNLDVVEQSVWLLGNIAGDSVDARDMLLGAGMMEPLLAQLSSHPRTTLLRNATWALSNLCRGKPQPSLDYVGPALGPLAALVYVDDVEVLTDACWSLSYISDGSNDRVQAVLESGVVRRLIELIHSPEHSVVTPALRTLGNLVTGSDEQTQAVLNQGVLAACLPLLVHPKRGIRKETCWLLSNITAGTRSQIQSVIDANLFPLLVHLLRDESFDVKKEAAWAVSNATSGGSDEHIQYLVSQGVIQPLVSLFQCHDSRVVMVALEGVDNILSAGERVKQAQGLGENLFAGFFEECGGLDALEQLQNHEAANIYDKAVSILQTYFEVEGDDDGVDEGQQGTTETQGATFSFAPPAEDDDDDL